MSLDFTDNQSTLVQVMAWCLLATSHYLGQCWPRFMSPYGVTRPQWVLKQGRNGLVQEWKHFMRNWKLWSVWYHSWSQMPHYHSWKTNQQPKVCLLWTVIYPTSVSAINYNLSLLNSSNIPPIIWVKINMHTTPVICVIFISRKSNHIIYSSYIIANLHAIFIKRKCWTWLSTYFATYHFVWLSHGN